MTEVKVVHMLVEGLVQGVSFRAFTKSQAKQLGLLGWVRNLSDQRVELVVGGHSLDISALKERLAQGPARAKVKNIECIDLSTDILDNLTHFTISEDGVEPWLNK